MTKFVTLNKEVNFIFNYISCTVFTDPFMSRIYYTVISTSFNKKSMWWCLYVCLACTIIAYTIKPLTDRDSINNMAWRFPKPGQDVIVIDKTVKNPWNIGSDYHATLITEKRSKYDRKITEPCTATCVLCNEDSVNNIFFKINFRL